MLGENGPSGPARPLTTRTAFSVCGFSQLSSAQAGNSAALVQRAWSLPGSMCPSLIASGG